MSVKLKFFMSILQEAVVAIEILINKMKWDFIVEGL